MNSEQTFATKSTKEKTPPEVCESGGRWPHSDGLRRQRKKRTLDSETEECQVCKGIYKKGKGLKIHMTKSGCGKGKVQHRNISKSETQDISQDKNHSRDGSRAERTPLADKVKTNLRQGMDRGKLGQSQREDTKGIEQAATGKRVEEERETRKTQTGRNASEDFTEIHVEEELYQEVNSWVKKEIESKTTRTTTEKGTMKQPIIKDWLTKKDDKERGECRTEQAEKKHRTKTLVQPDIRTVIVKQEDDSRLEKPQEHKRTVLIKAEDRTAEKKLKEHQEDKRTVLVKTETEDKSSETKQKGKKKVDVRNGPGSEVLAENWIHLSRADFRSLQGKRYLNDKIIDSYIRLIQERSKRDSDLPKVYGLTTFFYTQLSTFGLKEGSRRTKDWIKEDLRKKDWIFCPIHRCDHWTLIAIEIATKTIHYLDSLVGPRNKSPAPGLFLKYMEAYYRDRGEEASFKVRIRRDAPRQLNGVDCGVFVCQYAERMSRKGALDFTQGDMPFARKRMTEELLNGRLEPESVKRVDLQQGKASSKWKTKTGSTKSRNAKTSSGKQKETTTEDSKKVHEKTAENICRKEKVQWPRANSSAWAEWDKDMTELLRPQNTTPESKAVLHPTIIYTMGKDKFGIKERSKEKKGETKGPTRRQRKCQRLREEINSLKETYKNAKAEEKEGVKQLQEGKLKELRLAKRAESLKKGRKKYTKNCNAFLSHPYDFAREIISPKPKGKLSSSKEETEAFLEEAHSNREKAKEKEEDFHQYGPPTVDFDDSLPSWKEFNEKLQRTRNKSAPGPNGVPYLVYKKCPGLARLLYGYLKGLWRKNCISRTWREADGVFIPKEDGAKEVKEFRTISLLNVEGKLFFAMKAERLLKYSLANQYIDTSVQKGGVPDISGCMEHTSVISQMIREAKAGKTDLVITWLDIANAYGSIPHSLIMKALQNTHVPERVQELVKSYYGDVKIRFTTTEFTTDWQRLERGIITGCTLSVILFVLAMTMLVEEAKRETKGPKSTSGQRQTNTRLFMDDIATATNNLVQTKYLLEKLSENLKKAELAVKPGKCRSLVIIKGEISKKTPLMDGIPVTSITEQPIKYLGKTYSQRMDDREQVEDTIKEAKGMLKKIDRCKLPGKYKAWMMQFMMLPRLMWPLTIYNPPISKVVLIQRMLTGKLKKWLGLPRSLATDCLYSKGGKLQLPFTDVVEEFKAAKARLFVTLRDSGDPCVKGAGVCVDGGRKLDTQASVEEAESRLRMQDLTGVPNKGREGLGLHPRLPFSKAGKKEKRKMIVKTIKEMEEEERIVRLTNCSSQGAPMNWEVPERRLGHREVMEMPEGRLKFLVKSVFDLLPTPSNKNRWYGTEEKCHLCGGVGTTTHILSGCPTALSQGRYRWRHDEVLRELAQTMEERRRNHNDTEEKTGPGILFVKEGGKKTQTVKTSPRSFMDGARDWRLLVDLDGKLRVPHKIVETELRPDMLLISDSTKRMGLIELTVPSEDRVEVAGELKRTKYAVLQHEAKKNGWAVQIWAVEVGCRGFPAASMATLLREMGLTAGEKKRKLRKLGEAAERASKWLWNCSRLQEWGKFSS